jgi:DNA polymerase-4
MDWVQTYTASEPLPIGASVSLRYLFVDMNAFFASVEQQDFPFLRSHPVAVTPVLARTGSCIAANYAAKQAGVRVGTPVWEAERLCPGIRIRVARPERYVEVHHEIVRAVGRCIPVTRILSVDEMACRLLGDESQADRAGGIARAIKDAIRQKFDFLTCSIGAAPNIMLAKVASDLQKPDGWTMIRQDDLPQGLHTLKVQDFPGIGPRMAARFARYGVVTVERLCQLTPAQMCTIWGSRVHGLRWWYLLRGEDVPDKPTQRRTVGHSHVLPPDLRTDWGARGVLVRLIHKAAARLRRMNYWAGGFVVSSRYGRGEGDWYESRSIPHSQDTLTLLRAATELWERRTPGMPMQVGFTLTDLVPARGATPSLFGDDRRLIELCHVMDRLNRCFGPHTLFFGAMWDAKDTAPLRVPFHNIPEADPAVHGNFQGRYSRTWTPA